MKNKKTKSSVCLRLSPGEFNRRNYGKSLLKILWVYYQDSPKKQNNQQAIRVCIKDTYTYTYPYMRETYYEALAYIMMKAKKVP